MKRLSAYHHLSLLLLLLAVTCACTGSHSGASTDFTRSLYTPRYASGFDVATTQSLSDTLGNVADSPLLLTVKNPWQGADDEVSRLLILPAGSTAADIPEDYAGCMLIGPAKRIVAMSSTHVAMLDAIGAADNIVGVSGLDYISNAQIAKRRDEIADVGYEGNIDYESLAGARPDLVLLYGVTSRSSMEPKLRELGIPYVYVGDYLEQSPLGKAEWMVALGAITGRMHNAIDAFEPVEKAYNTIAVAISEALGNDSTGNAVKRPGVMLNAPTGDNWFLPPADSYIVRLIQDAGGRYLFEENRGNASQPVDMERARLLMSEADFWLNPGTATDLDQLLALAPHMADTPPVMRDNVWNNNNLTTRSGGNDFYESGTVRPDRVLLDLVNILHPRLIGIDSTARQTVFYHRLTR